MLLGLDDHIMKGEILYFFRMLVLRLRKLQKINLLVFGKEI